MLNATEGLKELREGNRRYADGLQRTGRLPVHDRRAELLEGQAPFAVVLGCSDSRVPAEMVFDQGLGDLFVIRVAGNIVAPSQVASVEFAVQQFGTRLVVVLGHSRCGAVNAALEAARGAAGDGPHSAIVDRILPSIRDLPPGGDLVERAVRANIRASVAQLRRDSATLEHLAQNDGLLVAGAEYCLESGLVEFLDPA